MLPLLLCCCLPVLLVVVCGKKKKEKKDKKKKKKEEKKKEKDKKEEKREEKKEEKEEDKKEDKKDEKRDEKKEEEHEKDKKAKIAEGYFQSKSDADDTLDAIKSLGMEETKGRLDLLFITYMAAEFAAYCFARGKYFFDQTDIDEYVDGRKDKCRDSRSKRIQCYQALVADLNKHSRDPPKVLRNLEIQKKYGIWLEDVRAQEAKKQDEKKLVEGDEKKPLKRKKRMAGPLQKQRQSGQKGMQQGMNACKGSRQSFKKNTQ